MPEFIKPKPVAILPSDWREIPHPYFEAGLIQRVYLSAYGKQVIVGIEIHGGEKYIHLSMSRQGRLPTWEDLREAKDLFIGRDKKAVQVLPPEDEHFNLNPYTLHLYCNLDRDPLPDFRHTCELTGLKGI